MQVNIEQASFQRKLDRPLETVTVNPVTGLSDKAKYTEGDVVKVTSQFNKLSTSNYSYKNCFIAKLWSNLVHDEETTIYKTDNGQFAAIGTGVYDNTYDELYMTLANGSIIEFFNSGTTFSAAFSECTIQ